MPGPIGKAPEEITGHRAQGWADHLDRPEAIEPTILAPDPDWHPIAIRIYNSLAESGQHVRMQSSDWAVHYAVCESLSRDLKPQFVGMAERWNADAEAMEKVPQLERIPLKGASLSSYLKAWTVLLMTEGDRRRLQMFLTAPKAELDHDATVLTLVPYADVADG